MPNFNDLTNNKIQPLPEIEIKNIEDIYELEEGWEYFDEENPPIIYRDAFGIVHIEGMVTGGDNGTEILELSEEFVPKSKLISTIQACENGSAHRVDIEDGTIIVYEDGPRDDGFITINFSYYSGE